VNLTGKSVSQHPSLKAQSERNETLFGSDGFVSWKMHDANGAFLRLIAITDT
jgi:hypothetical protein